MKWQAIEDEWPALKDRVRRHWFRLTRDDVEEIKGHRETLIARVQERYGFAWEEAEKEVDAWAFFVSMRELA